MLDNIVELFNNWNAGDVILFIVILYTIGVVIFKGIKKILDHNKELVTENIRKEEELTNILSTLQTTRNDLSNLNNQFRTAISDIGTKLENQNTSSQDDIADLNNLILTIKEAIALQDPKIEALEEKLLKIEEQISVLINSDVEYIKAYITDAYDRYVTTEKNIDLLTLQNIESVYNHVLQETGEEDEFLAKLMREIRNLPTTKGGDEK
jgi:chromosome segregation ATPase